MINNRGKKYVDPFSPFIQSPTNVETATTVTTVADPQLTTTLSLTGRQREGAEESGSQVCNQKYPSSRSLSQEIKSEKHKGGDQ